MTNLDNIRQMNSEEFISKSKEIVTKYVLNMNRGKGIHIFCVMVVWKGYILENQKALITTDLRDGMYYEVTYNAQKNEIDLNAYKKLENKCINL